MVTALRHVNGHRKVMASAIRAKTAAKVMPVVKGRKGRTWKSNEFGRFYGKREIQATVRNVEVKESISTRSI